MEDTVPRPGAKQQRAVRTCAIDGCEKQHHARGWCVTHWRRWTRHGDPLARKNVAKRIVGPGFWSNVDKSDGCWLWTGYVDKQGYGFATHMGSRKLAHRVAFELSGSPIPEGLTIDHLCHNDDLACPGGNACAHRRCVNPAHLEPVTAEENTRRAHERSRRRAGAGIGPNRCRSGHELTTENTYVRPNGRRECRTCARLTNRKAVDRYQATNGRSGGAR